MYPCIQCGDEVRARQHAISCDVCNRWQHRTCNTGISLQQYRDALKCRLELTYTCVPYRPSLAGDILAEERQIEEEMETENDTPSTDNPSDDTLYASFNISHRSFDDVPETQDVTMVDDNLPDHDIEDQPIVYTVLPTGSKRGKPLLVSNDGFSYGIKSKTNASVRWRCSVRQKTNPFTAAVIQVGDDFQRKDIDHNHDADPSIQTRKTAYSKIRATAERDMFRPALDIVEEVVRDSVSTESAQFKPKNNVSKRIANQHRAKTRPPVPKEINFEINRDFLHIDDFLVAQNIIKNVLNSFLFYCSLAQAFEQQGHDPVIL